MASKKNNTTEPTEATIKVEKQLLKTIWVEEAELILTYVPEEDLTKAQKNLLIKCVDKENFTDKQFKDLKALLQKYRLLLQKLKPDETLKNIEEVVELIQTEQEFLDMMENDEKKYLVVNLPYNNRLMEFEFEVLPITDSRVVESLELHIDIFQDFDMEEAATYSMALNKDPEELSQEEQHIIKKLNKMITDKLSTQKIDAIDNFLANQLILKGSTADFETRRKFWSKFHFNAKVSVFTAVQNRLGLNEISNKKLFPFGQ